MKFTKEQAIEEHRKMWNWIADQLENGIFLTVYRLKEKYCDENNFNVYNHCFCCEYAVNQFPEKQHSYYEVKYCEYCPLLWGTENSARDYYCEHGLEYEYEYGTMGLWNIANLLSKEGKYKEAAEIARQIANLPEKI